MFEFAATEDCKLKITDIPRQELLNVEAEFSALGTPYSGVSGWNNVS